MKEMRPHHYTQTSLECFSVMKLFLGKRGFVAFCMGNVFKYLWRHESKNKKQDIDKAGTYLLQLGNMKADRELTDSEEKKLALLNQMFLDESAKYDEV